MADPGLTKAMSRKKVFVIECHHGLSSLVKTFLQFLYNHSLVIHITAYALCVIMLKYHLRPLLFQTAQWVYDLHSTMLQ